MDRKVRLDSIYIFDIVDTNFWSFEFHSKFSFSRIMWKCFDVNDAMCRIAICYFVFFLFEIGQLIWIAVILYVTKMIMNLFFLEMIGFKPNPKSKPIWHMNDIEA